MYYLYRVHATNSVPNRGGWVEERELAMEWMVVKAKVTSCADGRKDKPQG